MLLGDYPDLQYEDILGVLEYAAAVTTRRTTMIVDGEMPDIPRAKRLQALNELADMADQGDFEILLNKDEYRR